MGSPELQRKVRQHDNDLAAVYEILTEIKTTQVEQGSKLDELGSKLDAVLTLLAPGGDTGVAD